MTLLTVSIQEAAEPSLLGRVFSIVQMITASAMPLAILVFGPLADRVAVQTILMTTGTLLVGLGVIYNSRKFF